MTRQLNRAEAGDLVVRILGGEAIYRAVEDRHFHPTPELFIQVAGTSRMDAVKKTSRSDEGDILIVPKGVPHREWIDLPGAPFRNVVVAFGRRTLLIHEAREGATGNPMIFALEQFISEDVGRLCGCLDMAAEWCQRDPGLRESATRGLMIAFFSLLLDNIQSTTMHQRDESFKVAQCRRMVSEHLTNPELNVQWLAARIACAPDYLSHLFRQETGDKLTQYINDKRIAFACLLLDDSSLNIAQVAYACGYRDPGYMTRQFQRREGCTPRVYRKGVRSP